MNDTFSWGTCNDCAELDPGFIFPVTEPGPGQYNGDPNFGYGSSDNDDNGQPYNNWNNYDLCGPGAANNALWYWPYPTNFMGASAKDPSTGHYVGYWTSPDVDGVKRMRGYIVQLGWNIHAPTWGASGMMQSGTSSPDWAVRDGMNWEASNHNTSTWQNYFYALNYPGPNGNIDLMQDVRIDVGTDLVPFVVLLNTTPLPNWGGRSAGHYITIIGYNNDTSQYAYTDTCGSSTGCNSSGFGSDGGVHVVDQTTLFNAMNIFNKQTPNGGDWIW